VEEENVLIVHLCTRDAWQAAQTLGEYCPPSLEAEGFIHCSRPAQVLAVANRFYRDIPDLLLLWIRLEDVQPEVRFEVVGSEDYPHIYGPLSLESIAAAIPIFPDADGSYRRLPQPPEGLV